MRAPCAAQLVAKVTTNQKPHKKPTPIVLLLFFCCRCFYFFYLRSAAPVAKRVRGNGSGTSGGELRPLDREMAAQSAAPRSRTVPSNSSAPRSATREKSAPGAVPRMSGESASLSASASASAGAVVAAEVAEVAVVPGAAARRFPRAAMGRGLVLST